MKKVLMFLVAVMLAIGVTGNAGAYNWTGSITLSDAYDYVRSGTTYKAYDVIYNGEATDYLDMLTVSIGYDMNDVAFSRMGTGAWGFTYTIYDEAGDNIVWQNDSSLIGTYSSGTTGLVYNIFGESPYNYMHEFFPVGSGQTTIFTLLFTEVEGGNFDDTSVYFTVGGLMYLAAKIRRAHV
jgi:hypothetical protein